MTEAPKNHRDRQHIRNPHRKGARTGSRIWAAVLLSSLLTLNFPASAQPDQNPYSQPQQMLAPPQLSGEDLLRQRIGNLVQAQCQELNIPGYALAIVKDGKLFYSAGFGLADMEQRRPATAETIFGLASVTKTFTALALLSLVDRGQINLDGTVATYLPEVRGNWRNLTIRQLASMTAGIPKGIPREVDWPDEMQILEKQPLLYPPGSNYTYSNPSFRLLGTIIEKVTGTPYLKVVRDLITDPLNMPCTGAPERLMQTGLVAAPYGDQMGQGPLRRIEYKRSAISFSAGILFSNVLDLARYAQALMDRKVVSPAAYEQLWFNRPGLPNGQPSNWAFGWGSTIDPTFQQRRIGMNGGDPAVSSTVLIFPDSRTAIIGLSNLNKPPVYRIARMVARMVLGAEQSGALNETPEGEIN